MRYILLFCSLFWSVTFVYAQTTIQVIVKDTLNTPLEFANIQVLTNSDSKTIVFGNTNADGLYSFTIHNQGMHTVKVSYLGYSPEVKTVDIIQNQILNFSLKPNIQMIEEVIIKANNSGLITKGDTLQYNIERFLNGTEETLKDIIKRLPGMGINKDGKITSEGKVIDKLLVDGDEFFKNQHSLATENISPEMIEGIQRIKNFKEFGSVVNNDTNDIVAVNVKLKDTYKNKVTGNLLGQGGYKDKYKLGSTIMRFNNRLKTAVISSINNTGELGIQLNDYFDLIRKDIEGNSETSSVIYKTAADIPSFIAAGNSAKKRKTVFTALTVAYIPSRKVKLNAYSIFNKSNQVQEQFLRQEYYNTINPFTNVENSFNKDRSVFNKTIIDAVYVPNTVTTFKYTGNFDLLSTNGSTLVANYDTALPEDYFETMKSFNYSFMHSLEMTTKISRNNILKASIFADHINVSNDLSILSGNPFLELDFYGNKYQVDQHRFIQKDRFGYIASYSVKMASHTITMNNGFTYTNEILHTNTGSYPDLQNNIYQDNRYSTVGIDYQYNSKKAVSFGLGITHYYQNINFTSNKIEEIFFLPRFNVRTIFNSNNILDLNYKFSNSLPAIEYAFPNRIISNYRNLYSADDIRFNTRLPTHQIGLSYSLFNLKGGYSIITNFSYNIKENSITSDVQIEGTTSITKYRLSPHEKIFSSMLFVEKRFSSIFLRSGINFSNTKNYIYMSGERALFKSDSYSADFSSSSNFVEFPLNFECGISITRDNFFTGDKRDFAQGYKPYLELSGKISLNFFWYLKAIEEIYITSTFNRDLFTLNPRLRYSLPKSRWEISLSGINVLNISKGERIESYNSGSYFQEKVYSTLRGFILLGVKYKL